ncbi:MAG: hypothetical protein ABSH06_15550 [Thermodesulfobacteriota bacterium]|jgi:hypothetical protein
MSILDSIRLNTLQIRDTLNTLKENISQKKALRGAAEDIVKRASTEITRQRTSENERKGQLKTVSKKVEEAQKNFEELDRKRQEALDFLIRCRDEEKDVSRSLRQAQNATEAALAEIKKEQKTNKEIELEIEKLKTDLIEKQANLRRVVLETLKTHLEQQAENVHAAFFTQEQRLKIMRESEAFKKARHTDPEIGRLCDQRDELRKFLGTAMVPAVKDMLQVSLNDIENQLTTRFPNALKVSDAKSKDNQIEELLFYINHEGKAIFLLPLHTKDWDAAEKGEITDGTSEAMCFVWNMIRELSLRVEDGDFITIRDRPAFESRFDLEEVAILEGCNVKRQNSIVLHFVLTQVPIEVQEVLLYED